MNHDDDNVESRTSVTTWLARLKAGDGQAGRALWLRYLDRLVRLGRRKLSGAARRVADEEDVALSAFHGFPRGVEQLELSLRAVERKLSLIRRKWQAPPS